MKQVLAFLLLFISINAFSQTSNEITLMTVNKDGVAINAPAPVASAVLDINSTNKGMLTPRVNSTQMLAIGSPANGLIVYNTDSLSLCFFNGTAWRKVGNGAGSSSSRTGVSSYGSVADIFGNSIPNGYGVTVVQSYRSKLTTAKGWDTIYNHALDGSSVGDQATFIYVENPVGFKQYLYDLVANDYRLHTNAIQLDYYRHGFMDEVAFLATDTSKRVGGSDARVTKSGTWTTTGIYGGLTTGSTQVGATLTYKSFGTDLFISSIKQNGNGGSFSIAIDGVVKDTISHPNVDIVSIRSSTYAPYLVHYSGLYDSAHTIVIKVVTCPNTSTDRTYITWIGGNGGGIRSQQPPAVYVNDGNRMTAAGYTSYGGSDALCAAYNKEVYDGVDELAAAGLNVVQVRGGSAINPLTDLLDGLHPNAAGHAKEVTEYMYASNSLIYPVDRQRAARAGKNSNVTNIVSANGELVSHFVASETSVTAAAGTTYYNPSSAVGEVTMTLPTPLYDQQRVHIHFGGTIAAESTVATSLSVEAGAGRTIYQKTAPGSAKGGDNLSYQWDALTSRYYRIDVSDVSSSGPVYRHNSTFTAADGTAITAYTPEVGSSWSNILGVTTIQSNAAVGDAGYTQNLVVTNVPGSPDYTITLDATTTATSGIAIQLFFRLVDNSNFCTVGLTTTGAKISDYVAGAETVVASTTTSLDTSPHTHQIVVSGNNVTYKRDGATILTTSSMPTSNVAGTTVGFNQYGGSVANFNMR